MKRYRHLSVQGMQRSVVKVNERTEKNIVVKKLFWTNLSVFNRWRDVSMKERESVVDSRP